MRGMRRLSIQAVLGALALAAANTASASDVTSVSGSQPLTVEDAYPTGAGTVGVEASFRWDRERGGTNLFEPDAQIKWGAAEKLQLSLGVPYRFGSTSSRDSGQVAVDALYQLTDDRDWLPATALSPGIAFPLGLQEGTETSLSFLATKSLTGSRSGPAVHLNVTWYHMIAGGSAQRTDRYEVVVGYSHPVGPATSLIFDVVREQDRTKGQVTNLVEVGIRRQIAEKAVFSIGAGAGIGDASPIARVVAGVQQSF
ncbi:MAG: hypothetical protein AB7F35_16715 [Acetobacteraceae bacterium]